MTNDTSSNEPQDLPDSADVDVSEPETRQAPTVGSGLAATDLSIDLMGNFEVTI